MNRSNFIQPLESRTLFNTILPPTGHPGPIGIGDKPAVQMELNTGGGSTYTTDGGSGTVGNAANARQRFVGQSTQLA